MASAKLRKYNAIPRGDDKKAIDALTRIAETLTGATGDKLEKALTLRDLEALDLVTIQNGLNKQGSQFTNIIKVGDTVTEADSPAKPVNFDAVGTYTNIILSWDNPTYKGHLNTLIYRNDVDVLGTSKFIGSTISSLFPDPVGTNSSYYYWIRHVNINGDKGPYNDTSGVFAETAPDVEYLLEQLTDQINSSHLAVELRDDIDWISKPDGLIDRSIKAKSDIQYLGIDSALIRNGLLESNKELLNIGSAIHDFRKGYEERVASGERLIDAAVYIDPDSGLIINRAFSYTDQSFTNAEILINGVDGRINLAVDRVTDLENKSTLATSSIELLAGEIDLRATYSEVNSAVASGIASLIPKYSFQFNSDAEGFTGVSYNASGWITATAASPAVSPTLNYEIEDYPVFRVLVRLHVGGTWNGQILTGLETIPVEAPSTEDSWEVLTIKSTNSGTITGLTFDLGDVDIDFIEIAKQGSNDLALEGLTARVTIAESNINAIDGTFINGIITTWYNGGATITSDVNTLINSFDSTYSVSATLTAINTDGTIEKANTAQSWVSAANANIRDVVFAYNEENGISSASLDLDAINGRITSQVFTISGIEKDIYSTQQASLLQEYYLHQLRIGGDTGNAKLALADSQLRAYIDENGNAVAEQILELIAVNNGNSAKIIDLDSAIASEAEARTLSIESLAASFNGAIAGVDEIKSALAYDDGAIAINATDVYVTVEGVQQGIQEYAEVVAQQTVDGSDVAALWTVKTTIGELTAGFGLYNDGVKTSFLINAKLFSIISPIDDTATPLLTVIEGDLEIPDGVYISNAYIQDAYVVNLVAATINADYINALDVDVAGKLTATGVDFNGGAFVVTPSGAVEAKNITIKDSLGNVILSSGGTVNIDYSGLSGLPTLGSLSSLNSLGYSALTGIKPPSDADKTATSFTQAILEANSGLSATNYSTFINAAFIKDLLVDQLIAANIYAENVVGDTAAANSKLIGPLTFSSASATEKTIMEVEIASVPYARQVFIHCPWFVPTALGNQGQVMVAVYSQTVGVAYLGSPTILNGSVRGAYAFSSNVFAFNLAANEARKYKLTGQWNSGTTISMFEQGYKVEVIRDSSQITFL